MVVIKIANIEKAVVVSLTLLWRGGLILQTRLVQLHLVLSKANTSQLLPPALVELVRAPPEFLDDALAHVLYWNLKEKKFFFKILNQQKKNFFLVTHLGCILIRPLQRHEDVGAQKAVQYEKEQQENVGEPCHW